MFDNREYDPRKAYGQAKTANVLFAVELTNRWSSDAVFANVLMPGGIWTRLQRHWSEERVANLKAMAERGDAPITMKTPEQGASTFRAPGRVPGSRRDRRPLLRRLPRGRSVGRGR